MLKALFGGFSTPSLTIEEYRQDYVDTQQAHQLIDVRTVQEFKQGHLPQAINIPLDELDKKLSKISKSKPVIMVCASGARSGRATQQLQKAGYENVQNLKGGTTRWRMAGHAVTKK